MTETPLKHSFRPQRLDTGCRMCGRPENDGRHWVPAWMRRMQAVGLPPKDMTERGA